MHDVITVRGLSKRYGKHGANSDLDLSVTKGEVYGFLGPNGAGKSTTIRVLMGITKPSGGEVSVLGRSVRGDVVALRQRIGYVAQEQSFYGYMTAAALARFVRGFYPTWDEAEWRRVTRLLELPLDVVIDNMSGGTRVKVALGLALAHRPELLLLDEPTAGLDPVARREFLEIVRDDHRAHGRTTFFSTHLVDEIELIAPRLAVIDAGRTAFEGEVTSLRDRVRRLTLSVADDRHPDALVAEVRTALAAASVRIASADVTREALAFTLVAAEGEGFLVAAEIFGPEHLTRVSLEEAFIALVRHRAS